MKVTVPIFVKPMLAQQLLVMVLYSKYNENLTSGLATGTIIAGQRCFPQKALPSCFFVSKTSLYIQFGYNFFSVQ